jgi:hypothetical protein
MRLGESPSRTSGFVNPETEACQRFKQEFEKRIRTGHLAQLEVRPGLGENRYIVTLLSQGRDYNIEFSSQLFDNEKNFVELLVYRLVHGFADELYMKR